MCYKFYSQKELFSHKQKEKPCPKKVYWFAVMFICFQKVEGFPPIPHLLILFTYFILFYFLFPLPFPWRLLKRPEKLSFHTRSLEAAVPLPLVYIMSTILRQNSSLRTNYTKRDPQRTNSTCRLIQEGRLVTFGERDLPMSHPLRGDNSTCSTGEKDFRSVQ